MEKTYFLNREQYLKLKAAWKVLSDNKDIQSSDIIIYNVLRGKPIERGFTKTTNPLHRQGNDDWNAFNKAKQSALSKFPECSASTYWLKTARKQDFKSKAYYEKENEKLTINFEKRFGIPIPYSPCLSENIIDAKHEDADYVYLFIRENLSVPQQIIQAAHAVELNTRI